MSGSPYCPNFFGTLYPIVYFADADSNPEPKYIGKGAKWEKIKEFYRKHAKQFVYDLSAALKQ